MSAFCVSSESSSLSTNPAEPVEESSVSGEGCRTSRLSASSSGGTADFFVGVLPFFLLFFLGRD
jgi:hypothetical protein